MQTNPTIVYQITKSDLETFLQDALSRNTQPTTEQPTTDPEKLFTDIELQQRAKVSRVKLWSDRKKGRLAFVRIGNMIRYRESDIQEYLKVFVRK